MPLYLSTCRRCGQEQNDYATRGGALVSVATPCTCSPLWLLNPDHPDAVSAEKGIRTERKRHGLCVWCSRPAVGRKGKAQYCEPCRKDSRADMQRRHLSKPETRRRLNGWQKKRRKQRLATDPTFREAYQTRYLRSIPPEGTPEHEAFRAAQQSRRDRYKPRKKQLRKKENRFQNGEKPRCARCGAEVEWGGVGKPRKYCPKHEPVTLRCDGCGRGIRWVPKKGPRPRFHDARCRRLAARKRSAPPPCCATCGEAIPWDPVSSRGKTPKYHDRRECKPVQRKCACGCGRFFSVLRGRRGRPPKYHPLCRADHGRNAASTISAARLLQQQERDRVLRRLFAEGRGPGEMSRQTGLPITRVRDALQRLGLAEGDDDQVYSRREWWEVRLVTWGWPAWQAIAEAGLRSRSEEVDRLLDRFGLLERAQPTRGRPRTLPQLRDRVFLAELLERHRGSYAAAAREVGCMADYLARQAHLVLGLPKQSCGPRPVGRTGRSSPRDLTACWSWESRLDAGATLDELVEETGGDADTIVAELTAAGLDAQLWRNVAREERGKHLSRTTPACEAA